MAVLSSCRRNNPHQRQRILDIRLKQAVQAIQNKDLLTARKLLASILKDDPQNERAWLYLTVCVTTPEQKQECLRRVLVINPHNQHALRAQSRLSSPAPVVPHAGPSARLSKALDFFISLLLRVPLAVYGIFLFFVVVLSVYAYYRVNTDFFGLTSPNFEQLTVMDQYEKIQDKQGDYWKISYESPKETTFTGYVRHISANHEARFPFLTHDILITTEDYADPELVQAYVVNHHFVWRSRTQDYPKGTIHLLHVIPENEELYQQILRIRAGDTVSISGREILRITSYNAEHQSQGWWQDDGCNTTLVKQVVPIQ